MQRATLDSLYGNLLGNPSASKGGYARAASLSPSKRSQIAKKAAQARWSLRATPEKAPEEPIVSMNKHIKFGV